MPSALQFFAVQFEAQVPLRELRVDIEIRRPCAAIEHGDVTAAVMAFRDVAFEACVIERMVLDLDRHALDRRIEARPLGHRPTLEGLADLQAEVVVSMACMVQLDDEDRPRAGALARSPDRLRRRLELALASIVVQHHADRHALPSSFRRLGVARSAQREYVPRRIHGRRSGNRHPRNDAHPCIARTEILRAHSYVDDIACTSAMKKWHSSRWTTRESPNSSGRTP